MNAAKIITYMKRKIKKTLREHVDKPNNEDTKFEIYHVISQDFEIKLADMAWDFGINLFSIRDINDKHITSCSAFLTMEEGDIPFWFDVSIAKDTIDTNAAYERAMSIV